jgi:hypothetical protein
VLAAGLTGTALGLLGGRVASATPDSTPDSEGGDQAAATTTTAPPKHPTSEDIVLLNFAEGFELAARDLYQASLDAGNDDDLVVALQNNHRGFADVIKGILGTRFVGIRNEAVYEDFVDRFTVGDTASMAAAARELESIAVATHTELIGRLEGIDGAKLIASIITVEARQAAVLSDVEGNAGDFDALFDESADALTVQSGG